MAPSAPFAAAKRTLAMVASVLLPVQPKKTGMRGVFIFAVSPMISFLSSSASIEVSPVEPMINTADVSCSSWNFSKLRNAPKSTEPSVLNGVISATNVPVSNVFDIPNSWSKSQPTIPRRRRFTHPALAFRLAANSVHSRESGNPEATVRALGPRFRGDERKRVCRSRPGRGLLGRHQRRRREGADRRRWLIPALDFDERGERARALRERRGADVEGEHVGIAVPLGFAGRIRRVEPGAGRHHHHPWHDVCVDDGARET